MTYAVEFHDVSRFYGDVRAVDGVSIAIHDGEFFSMLGPSGSGKTTCLRLIAGFEQLSGGAISIFGRHASDFPRGSVTSIPFFRITRCFRICQCSITLPTDSWLKGWARKSGRLKPRRR